MVFAQPPHAAVPQHPVAFARVNAACVPDDFEGVERGLGPGVVELGFDVVVVYIVGGFGVVEEVEDGIEGGDVRGINIGGERTVAVGQAECGELVGAVGSGVFCGCGGEREGGQVGFEGGSVVEEFGELGEEYGVGGIAGVMAGSGGVGGSHLGI